MRAATALLGVTALAFPGACGAAPAPSAPATAAASTPVASPIAGPPAVEAAASPRQSVVDRGALELYLAGKLHRTETFEVARTSAGWQIDYAIEGRFVGSVTGWLRTDHAFAPVAGSMVQRTPRGHRVASTLRVDDDGYLVATMTSGADRQVRRADDEPLDLYIGAKISSLLSPLCRIDAPGATSRTVYPGTVVTLSPARQLPLADGSRRVVTRILTYPDSGKRVIVACENGWLAGEYLPRKNAVVVRRGDTDLADALRQLE